MSTPAADIRRFNAGRDPERLAMKLARMQQSPFIFLRGTCHLFYDRLPKSGIFRKAPSAWVCGDLHFENFGSYKGDNRLAYFDINDYDEATLAPCTWDTVRFLTSVLIGADSLGANRAQSLALCQRFIDAYAVALTEGKARWVERETSSGMIRQLLEAVGQRKRAAFLDNRSELKGKQRLLRVDGRKALPASKEQRKEVLAFMESFAARQRHPEFYRVIDIARRIAGTGSLGLDRYIILVEGNGSPDSNYLLDLKEAAPSSLAPYLKQAPALWKAEAERVVTLQRRAQAVSMAFLEPATVHGRSYILRGLLPSEDRVALNPLQTQPGQLEQLIENMGQIVAWSHLRGAGRQGSAIPDALVEFGGKTGWRKDLLNAAEDCAASTGKDWRAYCEACADGYFADLGVPAAAAAGMAAKGKTNGQKKAKGKDKPPGKTAGKMAKSGKSRP